MQAAKRHLPPAPASRKRLSAIYGNRLFALSPWYTVSPSAADDTCSAPAGIPHRLYAVFLTTGSVPVLPRSIPGIDRPNVYVAEDVLTERVRFSGRKIAVIGGGLTGMETAEYLQTGGNEVFEVEMVDAMGAVGFPLMIMDATSSLAKLGVRTMPGHKLLEIRENSILLEDNAGYRIEEACDAVIVALGARAQNTLEEALKPDMKVFTAGDAKRGGRRIPDAIHEAFQVALLL